ncbi:MAG: methyl-accepting chemotaxis protein [Bacteriovorax sp.]|nr:methyl-accepting chemotaxis protein [Bacteriovorax sp.]
MKEFFKNINFTINLKGLGGKIILTTFTPVLLMSLGALFVLFNVQTISAKLNSLISNTVPALTTSKDLVIEMRTMDLNIWKVFLKKNNPEEAKNFAFEFEDSLMRFNSNLSRYMKLNMPEKAEKIRSSAEKKWLAATPDFEKLKKLLQDNKTDDAIKLYESSIKVYFSEIGEILSNVEINNANQIEEEDLSSKKLSKSVIEKSIWGFGLVALFSMFFAVITVNKLMNGIDHTVESLSSTAHDLQNSSHKMNLVSSRLTSSVDSQISSITESVTAMDEIGTMIKNNDQSATHVYHLSNLTKTSAESGKKTVDRMIVEMKEISSSYDDIHKNVVENGEEIKKIIEVIAQIAKKTEIINDIVFQTKLLSFNASVEAARAGESGKGFTVVAEEVGNLARMSGQASSDINQMLIDSQNQVRLIAETTTKNIGLIVSRGRDKVHNGNSVASDCLKELNQIINCVNDQDGSINQISIAIKEQATGVDEVNKALKLLDDNTNESVEMSTRSKEAAKNLEDQSHNLRVSIQSLRKILGSKKNYSAPTLENNES